MPTSSIIHRKCPVCGKVATVERETKVSSICKLLTYSCGHLRIEGVLQDSKAFYESFISESGKTPYPFQVEGMQFLESANFRALLGDEMGLGKTFQFLLPILAHPNLLKPYLLLCKSGLKMQHFKSILDILGDEYMPQIIDSTNSYVFPNAPGYIISLDLLRRIKNNGKSRKEIKRDVLTDGISMEINGSDTSAPENDPLVKLVKDLKIKYVILDECQLVKNLSSQRTRAVQGIAREVPYFVAASGTPIENHAGEYFSVLNMVRADKFPRKSHFDYQWADTYWDGYRYKYGGLRNADAFREFTKDFIIRRKRKDVLPDLPIISRNCRFFGLSEEIEDLYKSMYKQFQNEYFFGEGTAFERQSNSAAYLAELRHITGLAKVEPCLDFLTEFLLETDRKVTVFTHHIDVADKLQRKVDQCLVDGAFGYRTIRLEGGMSAEKRDDVQTQFMHGPERVLIASTLAAGEGLNLQVCADCIMLEQQWVPTKEEQAECRFVRPGQTADKVISTYFVAEGTVDEYLMEIKARKRAVGKQTLDGEEVAWSELDIMAELMVNLAQRGGKKWGW